MAKITKHSNYRVVVIPRAPVNYGLPGEHLGWVASCEAIAASITRHTDGIVDAIPGFDTEDVCSFCGEPWREDTNGVPLCCCKAMDEHELARDHG